MKATGYAAQHEHHRRRECQFAALTLACLLATVVAGGPLALAVITIASGVAATHHGNCKNRLEREEHGL